MDSQPNSSLQVYFDIGKASETNKRFVNHSHLSAVIPDFVSQLVVPDDKQLAQAEALQGKYPVQEIVGLTWESILFSPYKGRLFGQEIPRPIKFVEEVNVAIKVLHQLQFLFENYGIIILDRNSTNILLKPDKDGDVVVGGATWKVYQVDFADVYDALEDTKYISNSTNLRQRENVPKSYKNPSVTADYLADTIMYVLYSVQLTPLVPYFHNKIPLEAKNKMDAFSSIWDSTGNLKSNPSQRIGFDEAIDYLRSLCN